MLKGGGGGGGCKGENEVALLIPYTSTKYKSTNMHTTVVCVFFCGGGGGGRGRRVYAPRIFVLSACHRRRATMEFHAFSTYY